MAACIFCLRELNETLPGSREHVFPEAIGGTLTFSDVCNSCNSHLGAHVDSGLLNTWFIQSDRLLKGLRGKKGKLPNPFQLGETRDERGVLIQVHPRDGKPHRLHAVYQETPIVDEEGRTTGFNINIDANDAERIPAITAGVAKRLGVTLEQMTTTATPFTIERPSLTQKFETRLLDIGPCLMKIAYEVAYLELGTPYLEDPIAADLRGLLKQTTMTWADLGAVNARGRFGFGSDDSLRSIIAPNSDQHLAALWSDGRNLGVLVRVFSTCWGSVKVSENAILYRAPFGFDAPLFVNDVPRRTNTRTTIAQYAGFS